MGNRAKVLRNSKPHHEPCNHRAIVASMPSPGATWDSRLAITKVTQQPSTQKSAPDRFFALFTLLRPGEGKSVQIFCVSAFLMLLAYYILKTLREPLLLAHDRAELKSYAYAATAGLLFIVIPVYGFLARHIQKRQLTLWMIAFFVVNLGVFYALGISGFEIGFAYYVWVGAMSLMLTAQFWGYWADTYNIKSGQRLFPALVDSYIPVLPG